MHYSNPKHVAEPLILVIFRRPLSFLFKGLPYFYGHQNVSLEFDENEKFSQSHTHRRLLLYMVKRDPFSSTVFLTECAL